MARGDAPRRRPVTTDAELIGSLVAALADDDVADMPVDREAATHTIDAHIARPAVRRRPPIGDSGDDGEVARLLARRLVELDSGRGGDVDPAR